MERLTQDGDYCQGCTNDCMPNLYPERECIWRKRYNKLRAYEDTGLEPEEAKAKCTWADNTCKLLDGLFDGSGVFDFTHIKELLTAESEGRLEALPCRVGDTVYHPLFGEGKLRCIYIRAETQFLVTFDNESHGYFEEDFGKTVFLTPEEAEAARKEADHE